LERPEFKERLAQLVLRALLVLLVQLESKAPLERLVLLEAPEFKGLLAQLALQESQGLLVSRVPLEQLEFLEALEQLGHREALVLLELEPQEPQEPQGQLLQRLFRLQMVGQEPQTQALRCLTLECSYILLPSAPRLINLQAY